VPIYSLCMQLPFVSVVIPVRNDEERVRFCIESLLKLHYPKDKFEVVIVGQLGHTPNVIRNCSVRFVTMRGGPASARNRGIKMAKGEIIAFTDSDCFVDKDWLKNLVRPFEDEEVGGVGGKIIWVPKGLEKADLIKETGLQMERRQDYTKTLLFRPAPGMTANVAYRKSVLDEVEGFDENFIVCEDSDLRLRVELAGYKFVEEEKAAVYHAYVPTSGYIKRINSYVYWFICFCWKHRSLIFGRKRVPSKDIYLSSVQRTVALAFAYIPMLVIVMYLSLFQHLAGAFAFGALLLFLPPLAVCLRWHKDPEINWMTFYVTFVFYWVLLHVVTVAALVRFLLNQILGKTLKAHHTHKREVI
jgi:cellulose synthase/poly-beta-1,6-N-acetylglucosamine synthase-like glycosyltransferase